MDPDLMTEDELTARDRVLITCTGCGETYGYAIATIAQQRADIEALIRFIDVKVQTTLDAIRPIIDRYGVEID
jgi:hypothetical protein